MGRRASPHATDAELEILQILWQQGPSTVREVQETLEAIRPTGYTTVLKLLQIMHEKGMVDRDESQRAHVYEARISEAEAQEDIVSHMLDKVFAGSATKLVSRALSAKEASPEDLEKIRNLLDTFEGDNE